MLELRIIAGRQAVPVFDLPAALGRRGAAKEIGDQIEALMAFMDDLGGDPDLEEDNEDTEHCGREPDEDAQGDMAWIEWQSRGSHKLAGGAEVVGRDLQGLLIHEDAEDDDPAEDDGEDRCEAADDEVTSGAAPRYRALRQLTGMIGSEDDQEPSWCGRFALEVVDGTFVANDR